jgi:PIN domain nuclease of toxin-antitoxin system
VTGPAERRVFDASALLAIAFDEPGAPLARNHVRAAVVSTVNWSEFIQRIATRRANGRAAAGLLERVGIELVDFDRVQAESAAELWQATRHLGLSLGDRACLSLGRLRGLPVLTADHAWAGLPAEFRVELLR